LRGVVADLVAVGLAGGGEQDQWSGAGGLGRERQVEQDERVGVPSKTESGGIERDLQDDQDGLADDEPRGAEEAGEAFSGHAEAVVAERSVVGQPMGESGATTPPFTRKLRSSAGRSNIGWSDSMRSSVRFQATTALRATVSPQTMASTVNVSR
jgi:hypothetical protein